MTNGYRGTKIAFLTMHESWPFWRQIPEHLQNTFTFGATDDADFLVIYDGINLPIRTALPLDRTLVLLPEPPSVKRYNGVFLSQFGHVLTVDRRISHSGRQLGWPTLNWFYGVRFTQEGEITPSLTSIEDIRLDSKTVPKNRLASVIVSDKAFTRGQQFRLKFVAELASLLGNDLDVFGRDTNPIADKRDAIAPYMFHIALENDCVPHYFTEKLLDSYLGGAFPIYRGASNIHRYFPPECLAQIPKRLTPQEAAQFTVAVIRETEIGRKEEQIDHAKFLALTRYNMFEEIFRIVRQLPKGARVSAGTSRWIQPEMSSLASIAAGARRRLRQHVFHAVNSRYL